MVVRIYSSWIVTHDRLFHPTRTWQSPNHKPGNADLPAHKELAVELTRNSSQHLSDYHQTREWKELIHVGKAAVPGAAVKAPNRLL